MDEFNNRDNTPFESGSGDWKPIESENTPNQEAQEVSGDSQPVDQPFDYGIYMEEQTSNQQPKKKPQGLAIASMVLGIIGLVLFCIWYIGIPCSIIGLILGGISSSKAKAYGMKSGMAVAGIVCSCIALGLNIIGIILISAGIASLGSALNSL